MEENIKTITIDAEDGFEVLTALSNALEGLKEGLVNNEKLPEKTRRKLRLFDVGSSVYAHLHPEFSNFPSMVDILSEEELEKLTQMLTELDKFLEAKYDQLRNTSEAYKKAMEQLGKDTTDAFMDALKMAEDLAIKEEAAEAENGEDK